MKPAVLVFLLAAAALAADSKPLLNDGELPLIVAPTFSEPLAAPWSVAKGTWTPEKGVLTGVEVPAQKHSAVLHHLVGLSAAVVELDFRLDGANVFYVGCDAKTHVGRVVVSPGGFSIAEDSVKPSHTLGTVKMPIGKDEWHHLRVEWKGDQMAARLDDHELRAQHPYLATPKERSWLAIGGKGAAEVRNLKISGAKAPAGP